jgi:fructoselysine-6-P-deglycase FrlB-like protein
MSLLGRKERKENSMTQSVIPLEPIPADYQETLTAMLAKRPQIEALTAQMYQDGVDRVYLVGAGGSLAVMYPLEFLFDQRATAFATDLLTSAEFVSRNPAALAGSGGLTHRYNSRDGSSGSVGTFARCSRGRADTLTR